MFVADCLRVNQEGHLCIEEQDTLELAAKYGTPLYVMSETQIRKNCQRYRDSLKRFYDGNGLALYASKAFCCKEICRIAAEEGMGLDVVSGGELYTAISAGVSPEKIYFHGNNKTAPELVAALEHKVGTIVVDNLEELEMLDRLAGAKNMRQEIMLRVKPGVDAHTHNFIRTGQIDSKFGFALETGEAMAAVKEAVGRSNVVLTGLHCHIGSQIFDTEPFLLTARIMIGFLAQIRQQTGCELQKLNLGGGFGIQYTPEQDPPAYETYMERVSSVIHEICGQLEFPTPYILMEPGRSIVGPAGITLYTVGAVKEIPGIRTYVSVDGGMTDNPRYALYQSEYQIMNAGLALQEKTMRVTLAGRCCESGDLIGENLPVQHLEKGDIVAVLSTGAYNYSMASHYNRMPNPPVVMIKGDKDRVIVRRETWEDLARLDV
ncbi:MAG: diaminopimelate decarboxylase [Oscillospiraceae bacterium]|nr:diaminopimelate decarboxylase [Oscillospiraceae bacterium]